MLLGLISDAHGNLEAFERGLSVLTEIGAHEIIYLGDAIGYLPGDAVVDRVRCLGLKAVMGNHEDMLLRGEMDPNRDSIYRLSETARTMRPENLECIKGWPSSLEVSRPCGKLVFLHGSPNDPIRGYVYPDTQLSNLCVAAGSTVFMGNTHRPFIRTCGGVTFVNIGSCGLPRDCGTLGSVCVFDDIKAKATIVRFNIDKETRQAIKRCGGVAPEVASVFARRDDRCFGQLYDVS